MLKAFSKRDWSDWQDRSAAELVDTYAGPGRREALFERLTRLKFELPCDEVSGAWLGARLYFREGSAPLGYIPARQLDQGAVRRRDPPAGGAGRAASGSIPRVTPARRPRAAASARRSWRTASASAATSSSAPSRPRSTCAWWRGDRTPELERIRYSALISVVCATRQAVRSRAYWINLASLDRTACGIFLLSCAQPHDRPARAIPASTS